MEVPSPDPEQIGLDYVEIMQFEGGHLMSSSMPSIDLTVAIHSCMSAMNISGLDS